MRKTADVSWDVSVSTPTNSSWDLAWHLTVSTAHRASLLCLLPFSCGPPVNTRSTRSQRLLLPTLRHACLHGLFFYFLFFGICFSDYDIQPNDTKCPSIQAIVMIPNLYQNRYLSPYFQAWTFHTYTPFIHKHMEDSLILRWTYFLLPSTSACFSVPPSHKLELSIDRMRGILTGPSYWGPNIVFIFLDHLSLFVSLHMS